MAELKCWRKVKTPFSNVLHSWKNKEGGNIDVAEEQDGMYKGTFTVFTNAKGGFGDFNDKSFKEREEAYKFAKKFMKEHDTC